MPFDTANQLTQIPSSLRSYKIPAMTSRFCLEPDDPSKILCDREFQAFPSLHDLSGVSGLLYFISVTTGMKYDETNESGPVTVDSIYMAAPLLVAQPMIHCCPVDIF